jgi:hypothetical protein
VEFCRLSDRSPQNNLPRRARVAFRTNLLCPPQ